MVPVSSDVGLRAASFRDLLGFGSSLWRLSHSKVCPTFVEQGCQEYSPKISVDDSWNSVHKSLWMTDGVPSVPSVRKRLGHALGLLNQALEGSEHEVGWAEDSTSNFQCPFALPNSATHTLNVSSCCGS